MLLIYNLWNAFDTEFLSPLSLSFSVRLYLFILCCVVPVGNDDAEKCAQVHTVHSTYISDLVLKWAITVNGNFPLQNDRLNCLPFVL